MAERSLLSLWGRQLIGLLLISVVLSLISLAQPLYMLNLYDRVLSSQSAETLLSITAITLFILVCYGGFDWARSLLQKQMGGALEEQVRPRLLDVTIRLAAVGAESRAKQRLSKLEELRNFVTSTSFSSLFDLVFVPIYFAALYLFHPMIFIVCLVLALGTVILALVGEWSLKSTMTDYWRHKFQLRDQESQLTQNAADTVPLGRLKSSLDRFLSREKEVEGVMDRTQDALSRVHTVNKVVTMVIQTLVLAIACYLVLRREVSVGVMFAVNIVATRAMQPLFQITSSFRSLVKAADGWTEISDALGKYAKDERAEQPVTQGVLRVRSLTVLDRAEDRKLLQNIHMDVDPAELVVVTGASGAGKSTLLRSVAGLIPDYAGSIELDHREIKHWRFDRATGFIGYLPQDVHLYGLSIAENITGDASCNMDQLVALCQALGLHDDLAALKDGYETIVNASAPQFSGGQTRLIGLARALWGSPKLIVLDEPTSGLDADRERRVLEVLERSRAEGASVLISTHSNALIRSATKILWLKWGQSKSYGLREDVLAKIGVREPT